MKEREQIISQGLIGILFEGKKFVSEKRLKNLVT